MITDSICRPRDIQEILSKFPHTKQLKPDEWSIPCPLGHKTPNGHATLKDAGDKALFH
jgi:hypothetical protein